MLARGLAEFDNLRTAVAFALDRGDADLGVRLVASMWPLFQLERVELLDWARQVLELPGAPDHPRAGYVYLVIANLAGRIGRTDESERASDEALRRPLDETSWTVGSRRQGVGTEVPGQGRRGSTRCSPTRWRVCPCPRTASTCNACSSSARPTGRRSEVDPKQLIADADALGIASSSEPWLAPWWRSPRSCGERAPDAVDLLVEALDIAEGAENRMAAHIANELLLLASGIVTHPALPSDVSEIAARTLDLTAEYPAAMGYGVLGLTMKAHHDNRSEDAATLAGYLSAHLADLLAVSPQAAEFVAGGPLERFVTPATQPEFERGQAMNAADFRRELERLAGRTYLRPPDLRLAGTPKRRRSSRLVTVSRPVGGIRLSASGERSVQVLECFGGASFDVGVPVGDGGGVRFGEEVSSPFVVARSVAFGEHRPPGEVGAGGEELGVGSVVERGGVGEVGVGFVVAAEDGGEAAEVVADRDCRR